jgi:DNA invertase Pin-like site-specific DNA recombinase
VISIIATIAKQERLRISERTKAGLERTRRNGTVLGRPKKTVNMGKLLELKDSGLNYKEISDKLGLSLSTLNRILRKVA